MGTNYQPIQMQQVDFGGGVRDAIMRGAQMRAAKQRHAAELLLRRRQQGEQERRNRAQEERAAGQDEVARGYLDIQRQRADNQQADRTARIRAQADKAAAAGNMDLARQLLASIGYEQDEAAKQYTFDGDFEIGQGGEVTSTPTGVNVAEQGPSNTYSNADGQAITVDPAANLRNKQALIDQGMARYRELAKMPEGADPADAPIYDRANQYLGAVSSGQEAMQVLRDMEGSLRKAATDRANVERSKLSAAARRKRGGGGFGRGRGVGGLSPKAQLPYDKEARAILKDTLSRNEYKAASESLNNTKAMLTNLSSGNDALVRGALGRWAKEMAGPGTVQEAEREEFVRNVGGKVQGFSQKAREWLNTGDSTAIPPAQLKVFQDALKNVMLKRAQSQVDEIRDQVGHAFSSHSNPILRDQRYVDWAMTQVTGASPRKTEGNPLTRAAKSGKARSQRGAREVNKPAVKKEAGQFLGELGDF